MSLFRNTNNVLATPVISSALVCGDVPCDTSTVVLSSPVRITFELDMRKVSIPNTIGILLHGI